MNNLLGGSISGGTTGIGGLVLDVTNAGTIKSGGNAIDGSGIVRNAGTIQGGTASVAFNGTTGTNQLILQTGSKLIGDATGSTQGATNKLELQGNGTADNNFIGFNTLDVNADATGWVWNITASIGATQVNSGTFVLDGGLTGTVGVNSGGTLAGQGTITGPLVVAGGTVAPGAAVPFSTLTVNGNVNFQPGRSTRSKSMLQNIPICSVLRALAVLRR